MNRFVPKFGLGAIALAAIVAGALWAATNVSAVPSSNKVEVDAVADGAPGSIQTSVVVPVGTNFTIEHEVTASPDAWTAEQTNMAFLPGIVAYVSGPVRASPRLGSGGGAFPMVCGGSVGIANVYDGCAQDTTDPGYTGPSTETGWTRKYTLTCIAPGTSPLHLLTNTEVGVATGTNFAIAAGTADPVTVDASVTCVLPISKDDGVPGTGTYLAGATVTWTVHIGNPTAVSIAAAPILDTVDPALTNVTLVSSTNGVIDGCGPAGPNQIGCLTPVVQPDPVGFDLVISADIPLGAAGSNNLCNNVVQAGGGSAQDCINVSPAGVSVTKTADAPNYQAGDAISWTITVTSDGPSTAQDVQVNDVATDGYTITGQSQIGGTVTCTPLGTTATTADWDCDDMAAGDTAILQVTGTVNDPNPADNTCDNSVDATAANGSDDSASASATCLSKNVRMIKDLDGDPNTDDSLQNLWICLGSSCSGNGQGYLDIQELVLNVGGDADGVGAFEFQLKFDHKIFDIEITETGWLYSTGRIPGALGIGGCAVTIVTENDIRFGCVSKDDPQTPGNDTGVQADGAAAIIHVEPEADLVSRLTPGQKNGVVRTLLNENCELADIYGDPLGTGTYDALQREIPLPGIVTGGLVEDCADITITVRMLEGDLDLDCDVDVLDDQAIAFRYGSFFGNLLYDPYFDLEPSLKDFDIDIKDLQKVFGRNGSTCADPIPAQDPQNPPPAGPNPGPLP